MPEEKLPTVEEDAVRLLHKIVALFREGYIDADGYEATETMDDAVTLSDYIKSLDEDEKDAD